MSVAVEVVMKGVVVAAAMAVSWQCRWERWWW
jgi:hypothetical protein